MYMAQGLTVGGSDAYANQAKLARDRGGLEVSVDGLASSIDTLQSMVERLADQLSPVLLPEMPQSVGSTGGMPPAPVTSSIVGYIHNLRGRLDLLSERLGDVMKRSEV